MCVILVFAKLTLVGRKGMVSIFLIRNTHVTKRCRNTIVTQRNRFVTLSSQTRNPLYTIRIMERQ